MTTTQQPAAGGFYYGWVMVAVAFITQSVSGGGLTYSYSVIASTLNDEFAVSRLQLMLPMTAMTLMGAFVSPLLGPRLDKFPLRNFMFAGALVLALGLYSLSLAPSMMAVTLIYGLLMAPVHGLLGTLCSSVLVSRWFSRKLALAMGVAAIGTSVGGFVIPPAMEYLITLYGWRETMVIASAAVLLLITPVCILVRDRPEQKNQFIDGAASAPDLSHVPAASEFDSTAALLRSRAFWLLAITVGFLFSSYTALLSNLVQLVAAFDVSRQQGAYLIGVMSAVGILGKLIFGAIADRIDMRLGLATAIVLVASGIGIFVAGSTYPHFLIGSIVMGLAAGGMLPVWGALMAILFGAANYGRVMGLMGPVIVVCNVSALPLTGYLYDNTGSYTLPLLIFVGLLVVSLVWVPLLRRPAS